MNMVTLSMNPRWLLASRLMMVALMSAALQATSAAHLIYAEEASGEWL